MAPEDTGPIGSNPRPVGPDPRLEQQGNTVSGGDELLSAVRPFLRA